MNIRIEYRKSNYIRNVGSLVVFLLSKLIYVVITSQQQQ